MTGRAEKPLNKDPKIILCQVTHVEMAFQRLFPTIYSRVFFLLNLNPVKKKIKKKRSLAKNIKRHKLSTA